MKKWIILILCLVVMALAGCGPDSSSAKTESQQAGVTNAQQEEDTNNEPEPSLLPEPEKPSASPDGRNVDLTVLSATMVYSEVYNMMVNPEDYVGKTVKMRGVSASYHDEQSGRDYFACIISDATACCSRGIEFELTEDSAYPEDGAEICVEGVFDTYQEDGAEYCTLREARLL